VGEAPQGPRAELASFTAAGEVGGLWLVAEHPLELVLREGWLLPRSPAEVLPRDARIAALHWHREPGGGPLLVVEGANLLLGGYRIAAGRAEPLADGDTLTVDHRDVGEPPGAVVGGLLIGLPEAARRPLRCLRESEGEQVEVVRPGAGRAWLQGGIAVMVAGFLPCAAAALAYPAGLPARSSLLLAAVACALAGAVGVSISRVVAHARPTLRWSREGLTIAHGGPVPHSERLSVTELDGFAVRLDRTRQSGWTLAVALRTRHGERTLDHGPHLSVPPRAGLPALAALEARRRDWIAVAGRAARALGRSPDAFVTVQTDPAWPPERARGAIAAGRISLS